MYASAPRLAATTAGGALVWTPVDSSVQPDTPSFLRRPKVRKPGRIQSASSNTADDGGSWI
jgi:hypothetical protein